MTAKTALHSSAVISISAIFLLVALAGGSMCLSDQCLASTQALLSPQSSWNLSDRLYIFQTIPRTVIAILVGAGMAVSGWLIQKSLQNPFASPTTLGINAGAAVGLIIGQLVLGNIQPWQLPVFAFAGAMTTSLLVYRLSNWLGSGALNTVLVGMAVALALGALSSGFMLFYENRLDGMYLWGAGSLHHVELKDLQFYGFALIIVLLMSLPLGRSLALFDLGEQRAFTLGIAVDRVRMLSLVLATLIAAVCVSLVGVLSFVGLVSPHITRFLNVKSPALQLTATAWTGATLLLLADLLARTIGGHDFPVPTGAMTTLVGGPVLIFFLFRLSKQRIKVPEIREVGIRALTNFNPIFVVVGLLAFLIMLLVVFVFNGDSSNAMSDSFQTYRAFVTITGGAALACSGLIFQGVMKNPLASPDISGVTTVGILVTVIILSFIPGLTRIEFAISSVVGSLLLVPVFYLLIRRPGFSPSHIALVGMSTAAVATTLNTLLLTLGASQSSDLLTWMSGTTYGVTEKELGFLLLIALPLILWTARESRLLDVVQLGNEVAHALGVSYRRQGLLLLVLASSMAAVSVAIIGGISFIGLMAPHLARILGFSNHRQLILGSTVIGATLLFSADLISQNIMYPFELPTGIATAIIGGAYFVLLLVSGKYAKKK